MLSAKITLKFANFRFDHKIFIKPCMIYNRMVAVAIADTTAGCSTQ